MPGDGADSGQHVDAGVVGDQAGHNHGYPALDDVDYAADHTGPRADLAEHVGRPAVVVADAANILPHYKAGEQVRRGNSTDGVGQQSQAQPAGNFHQCFHGRLLLSPA